MWHEKGPEDHWSCIAHLSAEDMLKSVVMEEKKLKNINLSDLEQGQFMTLTFGTKSFMYSLKMCLISVRTW